MLRQVGLTAAAIILGYNALLFIAPTERMRASDDGVRNHIVAEGYFDRPTTPAVLVGSSISARLAPDLLKTDDLGASIYNLSLLGEGAATGVELILHRDDLPKVVLVELTFGYRAADAALLQEVSAQPDKSLRRILPSFQLQNRPVDLLVGWMAHALRRDARAPAVDSSAGTAEPVPPDLATPLRYWVEKNAVLSEADRQVIATGYSQLGDAVDRLRAHNVEVILTWFPMHPQLRATPVVTFEHNFVADRFPASRYEWFEIPDEASYRTVDGMHPTYSSAHRLALVIRALLERALLKHG